MRTFEYSEGASNKFWNITLEGRKFTVNFGRIGSAGQTQVKDFPDEAAARKEHDKLVGEKLKKGYRETTPPGAAVPAPAPVAPAPAKPAKAKKEEAPPAPVPAPAGAKRTFEFSDESSSKFWDIEVKGTSVTVTYGRLGSVGQTQLKSFPDEAKARKEADKLIAEKTGKGYRETTPAAKKVPTSLRESLEQALADDPDELANHMAYADYLGEQGDPLGEFIRVQLALEDAATPAADRKKLQQQEKKLLDKHQRAWLGDLAPFLLDQKPEKERSWGDFQAVHSFRRGWLDSLKVIRHTVALTRALARSPQVRLLRRLELVEEDYEADGGYEAGPDIPARTDCPQLYPLARSEYLGNVRTLIVGEVISEQEEQSAYDGGFNCRTSGEAVVGVIKQMPKLEELYLYANRGADIDQLFTLKTLDRLRVLLVYHQSKYPLAKLAKNPAFANLTHLLLHPHCVEDENAYIREPAVREVVTSPVLKSLTHLRLRLSDMGDRGVKTIADSGILKRLKVLDLRHGCMTDKGARTLADCPDLRHLELLDLTHNALTDEGVKALEATGVKVVADHQWVPSGDRYGDREYLYAGDIE